jgi:hypothetical protein
MRCKLYGYVFLNCNSDPSYLFQSICLDLPSHLIVPSTKLCCAMPIEFVFAVATVWNGKLTLLSEWYITKAACDAEYEDMGRSMHGTVLAGKAFFLRKAIWRSEDPDDTGYWHPWDPM